MTIEKNYKEAVAEYYCNVNEFISNGERQELTRLESLHIRTKYPNVELWYDSLDSAGKQVWNNFCYERYGGSKWWVIDGQE